MPASTTASEFLRDALLRAHGVLEPLAAQVAQSADVESVHEFRVNARRTRAMLALFKPLLPRPARALSRRLRALARKLADLRDIDVTLERIAEWTPELPGTNPGAVTTRLAAKRRALEPRVKRAIASADARDVLTALSKPPKLKRDGAFTALLHVLLRRILARFRRAGKRAARKPVAGKWHKLRLRGKELRYVLELVGPRKSDKAVLNALRELHECLGEFFDARLVAAALEARAPGHAMLGLARNKAAARLRAAGKLLAKLNKALAKLEMK